MLVFRGCLCLSLVRQLSVSAKDDVLRLDLRIPSDLSSIDGMEIVGAG
jgi:hypothetical protein